MLYLESFSFNAFQENTYLIHNEYKECWIVDPGMYDPEETSGLIAFIEKRGFQPKAIINTHTHLDHIFGVKALKDKYKIPFYIHKKEIPVLQNAVTSAMMFGFDFKSPPAHDFFIDEAEPFYLSKDVLEIKFTPGHSPGSIVFYYPAGNWVISGDVLFNGSIGRTDLPGGDYETLINSIKSEIFTLPDNTVVYSGHGPSTAVGYEKKHNPFVRE